MNALTLGLIAAAAWGFHDICVRRVSQSTPLAASLFVVLLVGLAFHVGLMAYLESPVALSRTAGGYAALAGVYFLVASLGLYGAFQRGPVALVSPIIASFPILSVTWAATQGAEVTIWQWGAVLAIILGVSLVAALSDDDGDTFPPKTLTIIYAGVAAIGFAMYFALGHLAVGLSDDMPVTMVTRVTAIIMLILFMRAKRLPFWPGWRVVPVLCLMGIADGIAVMSVLSAGSMPDAQYAAVAASVFGLLTIIMAWALLGERMSMPQWIGCAIAFSGIGYLAA